MLPPPTVIRTRRVQFCGLWCQQPCVYVLQLCWMTRSCVGWKIWCLLLLRAVYNLALIVRIIYRLIGSTVGHLGRGRSQRSDLWLLLLFLLLGVWMCCSDEMEGDCVLNWCWLWGHWVLLLRSWRSFDEPGVLLLGMVPSVISWACELVFYSAPSVVGQ